MEENKKCKGHWKRFIIFTLIVGIIVGYFSVISDNLPDLRNDVTVFEYVISYLAVIINSLPVWFILAMLVGYIFASDIRKAMLYGAIYTLTAITFYFLFTYFYGDVPVQISFKELAIGYGIHYGASAVGGTLGGILGFLVKKTPYTLLCLLLGLILQLYVNGTRSWRGLIGIGENVTYCVLIMGIVIYLVNFKRNERKETAFDFQ